MNLISSASAITQAVCRTPSVAVKSTSGFLDNFLRDKFVEFGVGAVGQKNRAGLRVQGLDVPDAVVLLVRPRQLVLFDGPVQVFLATGRGDEAGLRMLAHDLPVKIKTRLRILLQRAVAE